MAFNKRTWLARQGTGLNKFNIGTLGKFELVNAPDEVSQEGDALSATNMNDLENRIATGCVQDVQTSDGTSVVDTSTMIATIPDGGGKFYLHSITFSYTSSGLNVNVGFRIVNHDSSVFTYQRLIAYIMANYDYYGIISSTTSESIYGYAMAMTNAMAAFTRTLSNASFEELAIFIFTYGGSPSSSYPSEGIYFMNADGGASSVRYPALSPSSSAISDSVTEF